MAKKKRVEEPPKGSPAWMATFSDLMNLLLCFFVLLFSMSSVDQAKWDAMAQSLASTFSIFQAGSLSFGDGTLLSNGASQLNNLDEYYNNMGESSNETDGESVFDETGKAEFDKDATVEEVKEYYEEKIEQLEEKLEEQINKDEYEQQQLENKTTATYDEIGTLLDKYNLTDYLDLSTDTMYNYVIINVKGSVLFERGSAELMSSAEPVLAKIAEVLKVYSGCDVEIIGHTDNEPFSSAKYKNNRELSQARALSTAEYLIERKKLDERYIYYTGRGDVEPVASNDTADGRAHNRRIEIRLYMTGKQ